MNGPNSNNAASMRSTYLERGEPVVVLARWNGRGPRNVLIRRENGTVVVRPFRGLRKPVDDLRAAVE
jgi:acetyl esterase